MNEGIRRLPPDRSQVRLNVVVPDSQLPSDPPRTMTVGGRLCRVMVVGSAREHRPMRAKEGATAIERPMCGKRGGSNIRPA
jgi:hypothetical protein